MSWPHLAFFFVVRNLFRGARGVLIEGGGLETDESTFRQEKMR
jgi:hypothetical protein